MNQITGGKPDCSNLRLEERTVLHQYLLLLFFDLILLLINWASTHTKEIPSKSISMTAYAADSYSDGEPDCSNIKL